MYDLDYAEARLNKSAENFEKRGFYFFSNFTKATMMGFIDLYLRKNLKAFPENSTIENDQKLENLLSTVKALDTVVGVFTSPASLSDGLKIGALMNIERYRYRSGDYVELMKKLHDSVTEIVKKESSQEIPFEKADPEIEKIYLEMHQADPMVYSDPHGANDIVVKSLRKNVHQFGNATITTKFYEITDKLSAIYDEISVYVPIHNVGRLNKIIGIVPRYLEASDAMEGYLKSVKLDCSAFRCKIEQNHA